MECLRYRPASTLSTVTGGLALRQACVEPNGPGEPDLVAARGPWRAAPRATLSAEPPGGLAGPLTVRAPGGYRRHGDERIVPLRDPAVMAEHEHRGCACAGGKCGNREQD